MDGMTRLQKGATAEPAKSMRNPALLEFSVVRFCSGLSDEIAKEGVWVSDFGLIFTLIE
jgi:hypothetical protein